MNRGLLVALALVAGASAYMAMQPDDSLVAPGKGGRGGAVHAGATVRADDQQEGSRPRRGESRAQATPAHEQEAWVGVALIDGVQRWQQRTRAADAPASAGPDRQAWVSMQPPAPASPPPPPPAAPPEPVAPPFPNQWVGRMQDASAVAASGATATPVWRAVVTGPVSTWVLKAGDVIEGQWRIDRIQERTMSVTYLPLQKQQTVVMR